MVEVVIPVLTRLEVCERRANGLPGGEVEPETVEIERVQLLGQGMEVADEAELQADEVGGVGHLHLDFDPVVAVLVDQVALEPEDDPAAALVAVEAHRERGSALVGHEPHLGMLAIADRGVVERFRVEVELG